MTRRGLVAAGVFGMYLGAGQASAQPLGSFSWQLQPFCNVLTLNVVQQGDVYLLDGYDDRCGEGDRAPVSGVATPSPNGNIYFGLAITNANTAHLHVSAAIELPSISGTWSDSSGYSGSFAYNASTGGPGRPHVAHQVGSQVLVARAGQTPVVAVRRAGGTLEAPAAVQAGDVLGRIEAQGFDGANYSGFQAGIDFPAAESWTPTGTGVSMRFYTTSAGSTAAFNRMAIMHDGRVGIGTTTPLDRLDVRGDIRLGTGTTGCLRDADGTGIAGTCLSDRRFKRDVVPFDSTLDKLARLTPVHYRWRASEFPDRHFGSGLSYGLLAQDVESVFPDLVTTGPEGYQAVNYSKLPLLTIQAVKELKAENDALRARADALEARLAALEAATARR
jgi:hypothetical protein